MKINCDYGIGSGVCSERGQTSLQMSADDNRSEKVSFHAEILEPLIYREAMSVLREIVVTDNRRSIKPRTEYFEWLNTQIENKMMENQQYREDYRQQLKDKIEKWKNSLQELQQEMESVRKKRQVLQQELQKTEAWREYRRLEKDFWKFLYQRDRDLWFVLDPVITVHPDRVCFEAFSVDESVYGCLSIPMEVFQLQEEMQLGTTNIDFSKELAVGLQRLRTYDKASLRIASSGFEIQSGNGQSHREKKIDLPSSWIQGFNQVSAASSLQGIDITLTPADIYDIIAFLKRHKDKKDMPRYMKWMLTPNERIRIRMEPFEEELVLHAIYEGKVPAVEKIWGRRRWLILEKLLPIAECFTLKLLGFAMPQFVLADLGVMQMSIGLTPWSSLDWSENMYFSILSGYLGSGCYEKVYALLKEHRALSLQDCYEKLAEETKASVRAGIGTLFRRGEGYYDWASGRIRFRQLLSEPLPSELYELTEAEQKVIELLDKEAGEFRLQKNKEGGLTMRQNFSIRPFLNDLKTATDPKRTSTWIELGESRQIKRVDCSCKEFRRGSRNFSQPCAHLLALYMQSSKFFNIDLPNEREHTMSDIMEVLL